MTDTVRKAADILYQRSGVEGHAAQTACQKHAQALHDAGLLAPDLPAPDECPPDIHKPGWHIDILGAAYAGVLAGRVWITNWSGWGHYHTPDEIRVAAHKLLAAAAAAAEEGNQE